MPAWAAASSKTQREGLNAVSDADVLHRTGRQGSEAWLVPWVSWIARRPLCPELVELPLVKRSTRYLSQNLTGFEQLYRGCSAEATSFDDLLRSIGAESVADNLEARLAAAKQAVAAIEEDDLADALAADQPSVQLAYDRIKELTDLLKTEFVTVLDLDLPAAAATDND